MKRVCQMPILAAVLAVAWLPVAQAQQAEAPELEAIVVADAEALRMRAEAGDAEAEYRLAEVYRRGFPLAQDPAKALELYRRSAGQGHTAAQFRLGELYDQGELVERDPDKAIEYYRLTAEQGHAGAQYALAHIYHLGSGVAQDMAAAMAWYRKAAVQGDEWSQLALGDQYRIGLAVPRDLAQSTAWYRRAAEQGNIFAQFELGNAYRFGNGVGQDRAQAMAWYRRSAEAGNPSAKLALAELENGAAAVAPDTELAAEPVTDFSYGDEDEVSLLLAHAEDQVAKLALTTPEGDNAYETYRLVLSLQPNNQAALAGIEQIGVKYVDLAEQAAAKGDSLKARRYAEKAAKLAPENPVVRSMTIPIEATQTTSGEPSLASETLENAEPPQPAPVVPQEETVEMAVVPAAAPAAPKSAAQDVDDLVFRPHDYDGRQVVVTGSVVHLLWDYRLKSETGQNSMAIDVAGLSPANRARLASAVEGAGFLGQVRARIKGTVRRQTPATFDLAASELTLIEIAPDEGKALSPEPDPDPDEVAPRVEAVGPVAPPAHANGSGTRTPPGDGRQAGVSAPSGYVPTCYRDEVWRRLRDGRIQTGIRTRCY